MGKKKGNKDRPWIVEATPKMPGSAKQRFRYEHESCARKRASQFNPQWFDVVVRFTHG
jgi:hypothetical protein